MSTFSFRKLSCIGLFGIAGFTLGVGMSWMRSPRHTGSVEMISHTAAHSAASKLEHIRKLAEIRDQGSTDSIGQFDATGGRSLLDAAEIRAALMDASMGQSDAALRFALSIRDPSVRDTWIRAAMGLAIEKDPRAALDLYLSIPKHLRRSIGEELGTKLGQMAEPTLMSEVMRHPAANGPLLNSAYTSWVGKKTSEALAFLDTVDDLTLRELGTSKSTLWQKIADVGEPESKWQYFERQEAGQDRTFGISSSLASILAKDPNRWEDLAKASRSNLTVSEVASEAAIKAATLAPENIESLLSNIPGELGRSEAAKLATRSYLTRSGRVEPEPVLKWVKNIQDPIVAHAVVEELKNQGVQIP